MMVSGCSSSQSTTRQQKSSAACASALNFGVVPDDGRDDRAGLQAALDACAGSTVELDPGTYNVVTPVRVMGRPYAMLVMPPDTVLEGRSATATTIEFSGDNGKSDWRGLQLTSGDVVRRVRLVSRFVAGSTSEQTHIARVDGPARGIHLQDVACNHPQNGSKSGDCLQVVGYAPDKLVWDVEVDHVDFENTGRSGVSVHSGLRGTLGPDGHWSTRIHDCRFKDISDQPIDGEGSGGIDGLEIDHNIFDYPTNIESSAAVQIQSSAHVYIHDNKFNGRGIDIYGCDSCVLEHNTIDQTAPEFPAVQLRKKSNDVRFVDEVYTRSSASGVGPVVVVAQKLTAPSDVVFDHVSFTQLTPAPVLSTAGIVGVDVVSSRLAYEGPEMAAGSRIDALSISGSGASVNPSCTDNGVASEYPGIRTTGIHIRDNLVSGAYRATVTVSGSYCGTGYLEVVRNVSTGPRQGLRCEGVSVGAGITGPLVFSGNVFPANDCALVP